MFWDRTSSSGRMALPLGFILPVFAIKISHQAQEFCLSESPCDLLVTLLSCPSASCNKECLSWQFIPGPALPFSANSDVAQTTDMTGGHEEEKEESCGVL